MLSFDELAAIWRAADDGSPFGKVVRLLLLTGARRMEIAGLRQQELRLQERLLDLPAERTKQGKPFLIALSEPAVAILETVPVVVGQDGLFASFSFSRQTAELRAALPGVPHFVLHDLRRSFATHANELGLAPPHIVDVSMGHSVGNRVSRAYNKAEYLSERRNLAAAWARHIEGLLAAKPARRVRRR